MSLRCGLRVKAVALALSSLYLGPLLASASTSPEAAPPGEAAELLLATYPSPETSLTETERNEHDNLRNEDLSQQDSAARAQLLNDEELAELAVQRRSREQMSSGEP